MRENVLATAGRYGDDWTRLVRVLTTELGLRSSGFFSYEPGPAWVISVSANRKSSFLIMNLGFEAPMAELTLPARGSARAITNRAGFSPRVRELIEDLGCSNCRSDCGGEELAQVDGVGLYQRNACNRRLCLQLASKEDFESIGALARLLYDS